jgi:preprotein translocase subunit SecA
LRLQRNLVTSLLVDAKRLMASEKGRRGEARLSALYRSFQRSAKVQGPYQIPQSGRRIKPMMLKTEAFYMQDNSREMPTVTDPLVLRH